MIVFDEVTKKYGKDAALNKINITFEKGKIYGLIGPNRSGKSTSLKLIAGLVQPSSGLLKVNDKIATRRIASEVSYLTELDMFYEGFTVKSLIEFSASQFSDFQLEKAEELVTFMHLDPTQKIKTLSKGNRGRLKLVISLSRRVPILLLDEPFSGLDPLVRESIVKGLLTFIDFNEQTVIIATHEIAEIEPILDEIVVVHNGSMIGPFNVERLKEEKGQSLVDWMKENIKQ